MGVPSVSFKPYGLPKSEDYVEYWYSDVTSWLVEGSLTSSSTPPDLQSFYEALALLKHETNRGIFNNYPILYYLGQPGA
jgi:hypothetical protein